MMKIKEKEALFGRYKLDKKLGSGGAGEAYLCTDTKLGTKLVLKLISKKHGDDEISSNEVKILKQLDHHGVPRLLDYFEENNYLYIFESYIEGTPLSTLIERYICIPEHQVVQWAIQLCEILDYLHKIEPHPVIYRDLKPSNILVDRNQRIALVDFGASINQTGMFAVDKFIAGTSLYSAPEQLILDGISDAATDIYGLGATLFQLLTGRLPSCNMAAELNRNNMLSKDIREIVVKCIEKEKCNRYHNMVQLKEQLQILRDNTRMHLRISELVVSRLPKLMLGLSFISYIVVLIGLSIN